MESLGLEGFEEGLQSPALPPEVTEIICSIKDGTGSYTAFWSSAHLEETYVLTLYKGKNAAAGPVSASGTSGTVSAAVDKTCQYFVGVAPSGNKEAEVRVPVFSDTIVRLPGVRVTGEHTLWLEYEFLMEQADRVAIRIENKSQEISRETELCPFSREIDLQGLGLSSLQEFSLYLGAASIYKGVWVRQPVEDLPPVEVNMEMPKLQEARILDVSDDGKVSLSVSQAGSGIWAGAEVGISLYGPGGLFYQSKPAAKTGEACQFSISGEEWAFASGVSLRIFLKAGVLTSRESAPQALMAAVPVCLGMEYASEDKVVLQMAKGAQGFYSYRILAGDKESGAPCSRGADRDFLDVVFAPSARVAYQCGKMTGRYSGPIRLQEAAYYLFGESYPCICLSDTPKLAKGEDIVIPLPKGIAFSEEIKGECFSLLSGEGGQDAPVLKMDKKVWDFSEGEVRESLKTEYGKFLLEAEQKKVTAEGLREIQGLLGDYLPQSLKEFAYYNYRYGDNCLDVFDGLVLRAEYSRYQYVGDDAVSDYENGFAGTFCQEVLVRRRDGKICLDPFAEQLSGGKYVPEMAQPPGMGNLSAIGAAGFLDTQFEGMRREYLRIYYPEAFPELSGKGQPEVCYNVSLMAASSRQSLEDAWKKYLDTGVSTGDAPVACFRGRAQITPCVTVACRGQERVVPMFATLGDLVAGEAKVTRKGRRVYCFSENRWEWMGKLPLYPGDAIEELLE